MADTESAETYAKRAAEMKSQAQRAETVYLQAIYASIADSWDRLAAQMQAADRRNAAHHDDHDGEPHDDSPPPRLAQAAARTPLS